MAGQTADALDLDHASRHMSNVDGVAADAAHQKDGMKVDVDEELTCKMRYCSAMTNCSK